jgi:hypothetical protein
MTVLLRSQLDLVLAAYLYTWNWPLPLECQTLLYQTTASIHFRVSGSSFIGNACIYLESKIAENLVRP